jgi:NTP pyrophosphatase (non-canonical NTP hydrolase)
MSFRPPAIRKEPVHRVPLSKIGSCSIDDYVADCHTIWTKDRERPVFDIYYRVTLHGSKLGEALRLELYDDAVHELGRVTIWLLSLVSKLGNVDESPDSVFGLKTALSEIIWNKYPNCCPVCFEYSYIVKEERDKWKGELVKCVCMARPRDVEDRSKKSSPETKKANMAILRKYAQEYKPVNGSEYSLDTLQDMFGNIYSANIFATSIESIGFHLLEEIGEIAEALASLYTYRTEDEVNAATRDERILDLENEIADTFSWIFTLSNKLRDVFRLADRTAKKLKLPEKFPAAVELNFGRLFTLSKMIWYMGNYGNEKHDLLGCRDCNELVCKCPIYLIYDRDRVKKHFPESPDAQ